MEEQTQQTGEFPDLPVLPGGDMPEPEQFEGSRVQIEGWEVIKMNSYFDPETNERITTPVQVDVLKIFTKPLGSGKKTDGSSFDIRANAIFNLKKDKDGRLGLSPHPNSNIQRFFKKLKVNTLGEIKGQYVTVTVGQNGWLNIVTK